MEFVEMFEGDAAARLGGERGENDSPIFEEEEEGVVDDVDDDVDDDGIDIENDIMNNGDLQMLLDGMV